MHKVCEGGETTNVCVFVCRINKKERKQTKKVLPRVCYPKGLLICMWGMSI